MPPRFGLVLAGRATYIPAIMTIWIVFALMTGTAVMAVLWPLSRHARARDPAEAAETRFYRDQIAEIERDLGRGLISGPDAEAARTEAARRLLRAAPGAGDGPDVVGEPALRRRRAVAALALSAVPLSALAVYGAYGSPALPAQPLAARLQADPAQLDLASALARIEQHLRDNPADGRGWEVVAPVYLRAGRAEEAARSYAAAVRLLGETGPRLASYGEALVAAKDGVVSVEARAAFERAAAVEPANPRARYYLALAAEQDGRTDDARAAYEALIAAAPAEAAYVGPIRERLARLQGAAGIAGLAPADRQAAVLSMVEGLAARLAAGGGTAEEWARLVRSYAVLGDRPKAEDALERGRRALAADPGAAARLDAEAREVGLAAAAQP